MAPGTGGLVALLLLLLGLSAVLAYQAVDAARAEVVSSGRALRGLASVATWELERRVDAALAGRLEEALRHAAGAGTAGEMRDAASRALAWCACPGAVRAAFRADGGRAPDLSADGGDAGEVAALAATLAAEGDGDADAVRTRAATVGGRRVAVAYAADGRGGVRGIVADADAMVPALFRSALAGPPLLPAALRGGLGNAGALAVEVDDEHGRALFAWPGPVVRPPREVTWLEAKAGGYPQGPAAAGLVVDTLAGPLAGRTTRVAVRPEAAARLGAGQGSSRLPRLLAVFALTLGLVSVALVQLRRQQELVRLRDDFVSGVSHELRTPLAQIRLFADLLESGRLTADEGGRSVRIINEEARRLSYLVENILHFSRAQRGASRIAAEPVEVAPLVRAAVEGFAPLARERHVSWALALEEGVVARVDRDALRQILLNLLDNAVKYGPPGQTVRVGLALSGFALRLTVDDAGPGVPMEERAAVWEPYRRLPRHDDGVTGGSGIGLSVVRDLVELHGGRVSVTAAPTGGARFVVELPDAVHAGPPGDDPSLARRLPDARSGDAGDAEVQTDGGDAGRTGVPASRETEGAR
jgi:signal transduction histidine kinase